MATREWAEKIKASTSKWIKTKGTEFQHFYWQGGYAAFSVSASNVEKVQRYIVNQVEHHRVRTFEEELREFFQQYAIEYDERFVWD